MAYIEDDYGRIIKIEEDGETVAEPIDRGRISEESRENYRTAVKNQNWKEAHKILFQILTGETI